MVLDGYKLVHPRVGTLKVQVMVTAEVTDESVTTRCTSTINTVTGQRDIPESSECEWPSEIVRRES